MAGREQCSQLVMHLLLTAPFTLFAGPGHEHVQHVPCRHTGSRPSFHIVGQQLVEVITKPKQPGPRPSTADAPA